MVEQGGRARARLGGGQCARTRHPHAGTRVHTRATHACARSSLHTHVCVHTDPSKPPDPLQLPGPGRQAGCGGGWVCDCSRPARCWLDRRGRSPASRCAGGLEGREREAGGGRKECCLRPPPQSCPQWTTSVQLLQKATLAHLPVLPAAATSERGHTSLVCAGPARPAPQRFLLGQGPEQAAGLRAARCYQHHRGLCGPLGRRGRGCAAPRDQGHRCRVRCVQLREPVWSPAGPAGVHTSPALPGPGSTTSVHRPLLPAPRCPAASASICPQPQR